MHPPAQNSPEAELAECQDEPINELHARQEERFSGSTHQDLDLHAEGHNWNENCQKSTRLASVDVGRVEDDRPTMDQAQDRIIGRRWAKNGRTVDAIHVSDRTVARDYGTDQSMAEQVSRDQEPGQSAGGEEQDTLPRRGHMKTLLAQWRQFEQLRKDDQLIELAASSERSRSTAATRATAAWLRTSPDSDHHHQQHRVPPASSRSQSCGPVTR